LEIRPPLNSVIYSQICYTFSRAMRSKGYRMSAPG
jgi:hypothetical protein